jgi:hypothetical protein
VTSNPSLLLVMAPTLAIMVLVQWLVCGAITEPDISCESKC